MAREEPLRKSDPSEALKDFDASRFRETGARLIGGIDEAGRGAWAGPLTAAVVVVDPHCRFEGLNDSKQLSPAQREALYAEIRSRARDVAVGWASAREIDRLDVLQATLLAARRALAALTTRPDAVLPDFLKLPGLEQPVEALVKGDARSQAVAAASVVAKVTRDRWMRRLDGEYPLYGFAAHKGYGAPAHRAALFEYGSSTIHRHSFRGVDLFENEYRVSGALGRLLAEIGVGALEEREAERAWAGRGDLLPECEEEAFRAALRHVFSPGPPEAAGSRGKKNQRQTPKELERTSRSWLK